MKLIMLCLGGILSASTDEPATVLLRHESDALSYRMSVTPGAPKPGVTFITEIELGEKLTAADPRYGQEKPLNDAAVELVLVSPEGTVDARRAVRLQDAGTFAASFTGDSPGVYGVYVVSRTLDGRARSHGWPLAVGVVPPPEDMIAPSLPTKGAVASEGNKAHGQALCETLCRRDVAGARPPGRTPTYLSSSLAAALTDDELLRALIGEHELDLVGRADLLFYLRSLHADVRDFFPDTAFFVAKEFTINRYGLERLRRTARIDLLPEEQQGIVFVAYGGDKTEKARLIQYDDTIARDRLEKSSRLGYVLFFEDPETAEAREFGIALGVEPRYPIHRIRVRKENSAPASRTNQKYAVFEGQGRFNDAKSLRRGPPALKKALLPRYLVAAELATMYYGAEREFTAFDDEFK